MARTWSIGIQHPGEGNITHFGTIYSNWTFPGAMREMLNEAFKRIRVIDADTQADTHDEYLTLISDIKDIADDPGIMDDEDQWEDMDFDGPFDDIWFIVED